MDQKIRLPVRQLVEFILRSGDIDSRYVEKDRMLEGAKAHRALQKKCIGLCGDYQSEVSLVADVIHNGISYTLQGRADGIFTEEGKTVIDEIKTTALPIEQIGEDFSPTHWAQGKCYAWMYALKQGLPEISVRLTYFNPETEEIRFFQHAYPFGELAGFVGGLLEKYAAWARLQSDWEGVRKESAKALRFPYPAYRKGQRAMAVGAYRAIAAGEKLYVQAPTGTGKTISALFPALKAMGEGKTSKIFYLTAKTVTRRVAEEALDTMGGQGLKCKRLTLTAKEKICFCEKPLCHPERCEYAKGHFDRVNDAIFDALSHCDRLDREKIEQYARKHRVCPFEFSLDLSLWADCVICDYNYVFDPKAYLRRFFAEGGGDFVFLVDEAHNLVDRSREMFSSELEKGSFSKIRKAYKGKGRGLNGILNKIVQHLNRAGKECGDRGQSSSEELPKELIGLVNRYVSVCERMLREDRTLGEDSEFLQLYFEGLHFLLIADFYDRRYVTLTEKQGKEVRIRLFCLDPSRLLSEALKRCGSAVLFSATLTPLNYFKEILGGGEKDNTMALDSPFDEKRLCLLAADNLSVRWKDREESTADLTRLLGTFVGEKTGNYILYFPSYQYMNDVFASFCRKYPDITTVKQGPSMKEQEREDFLLTFVEAPERTLVGFCVLGGVFSEGVDLTGSRLIGAAIVGVGLPQLNFRQDIIRDYFQKSNGKGFEYAYMYPGMNKVLQAAGRVIRKESDRGAVLLVDDRFGRWDYRRLFPKHWRQVRPVRSAALLQRALDDFWKEERAGV